METTLSPRTGLPPGELAQVMANTPLSEYIPRYEVGPEGGSMYWVTREQAADALDVGIRTVDRYIRRRQLTGYRGPLPGGGIGVRVWAADVRDWAKNHAAAVTP